MRSKGSRRTKARREARAAAKDLAAKHALNVAGEELRTQHERLEESQRALEESRARYVELFESAPFLYATTGLDGVIQEINRTGARLLGRNRKLLAGVPFVTLVAKADRRLFLDQISRCRAHLEVDNFDLDLTSTAGAVVPVRVTIHPGESGLLIVAFEEKRRKLFNEMRAGLEADRERVELERRRLRYREAELTTAGEARDRFLAMLGHELRTPLVPILAAVSGIAAAKETTPDVRALVETIRRNVIAETRLIDELLDASRIDHGLLELRSGAVDLHDLLREAVERLRALPGPARPRLELALEARRRFVWGDAVRLFQVAWNLIDNAVRHTPASGSIAIRTSDAPNSQVELTVRDTGAGIDPALLPSLFTPFAIVARDESSVSRGRSGLGLGLAICKGIVDAHGGRITAASDGLGCGSTFAVRLHSYERRELDRGFEVPASPESASRAATPERLRILLVDDHEDSVNTLAYYLRSLQHEVTIARSVEEALATIDVPHDVLISDVDLPDGTGCELLMRLSARRPRAAIALSGHGGAAALESAQAGFQEHLVKPVEMATLLAAVARALNAGSNGNGADVRYERGGRSRRS